MHALTMVAADIITRDPGEPLPFFRELNALVCSLVFAGLVWRLIGRWPLTSWLPRLLVGLFAAIELIVALGTARAAALNAPWNEAQYFIFIHGVVTLAVIILWHRLLDTTKLRA